MYNIYIVFFVLYIAISQVLLRSLAISCFPPSYLQSTSSHPKPQNTSAMENVKVTVGNKQSFDRVECFLAGAFTVCVIILAYHFVIDYEEMCACVYAFACLFALFFGYFGIALVITYIIYYGVCAVCYCMRAVGKLIWYVNDLLESVGSSIMECYFQIGMRVGPLRYMCMHVVMLVALLYYHTRTRV